MVTTKACAPNKWGQKRHVPPQKWGANWNSGGGSCKNFSGASRPTFFAPLLFHSLFHPWLLTLFYIYPYTILLMYRLCVCQRRLIKKLINWLIDSHVHKWIQFPFVGHEGCLAVIAPRHTFHSDTSEPTNDDWITLKGVFFLLQQCFFSVQYLVYIILLLRANK